MCDKQYLSETILKLLLRQLDELKQQSNAPTKINPHVLQSLVEQAQQKA